MPHNAVVNIEHSGGETDMGTADRPARYDVSLSVDTTLGLLINPVRREILDYMANDTNRTTTTTCGATRFATGVARVSNGGSH